MTRTMYDSVSAHAIHQVNPHPEMVAGYGNGHFAWPHTSFNLFPHAKHIRIDVFGTSPETYGVLDVERFDAPVDRIFGWVKERQHFGRAVVYFSRLNDAARAEVVRAGGDAWVADYTGHPHGIPAAGKRWPHIVAVQYVNLPAENIDMSVVFDDSWHGA